MFKSVEIMRLSQGLARHAADRQSVIAQNMAHLDTPGYRAKDVAPFAQVHQQTEMRASRPQHHGFVDAPARSAVFDAPGQAKPNGNTVALEAEMVKAAEVRQQHDLALSVYKSSLDILRSSLGRR